jgi:hypothetical protein
MMKHSSYIKNINVKEEKCLELIKVLKEDSGSSLVEAIREILVWGK